MADTLPEGTDHIIPGAAGTSSAELPPAAARTASTPDTAPQTGDLKTGDLKERIASQAGEYKAQATDKARDLANQGKERASGALDDVARLIGDNAAQIDDTVGAQYGDYARRAADMVSGAAESLRGKEVEELLDDARDLIRKSPAIALGAAAAAGFLLARVVKSGSESLAEAARTSDRAPATATSTPSDI